MRRACRLIPQEEGDSRGSTKPLAKKLRKISNCLWASRDRSVSFGTGRAGDVIRWWDNWELKLTVEAENVCYQYKYATATAARRRRVVVEPDMEPFIHTGGTRARLRYLAREILPCFFVLVSQKNRATIL